MALQGALPPPGVYPQQYAQQQQFAQEQAYMQYMLPPGMVPYIPPGMYEAHNSPPHPSAGLLTPCMPSASAPRMHRIASGRAMP